MLNQRGLGKIVEVLQNIESINTDILAGGQVDPTQITDADNDTFVKTEATLAENFIRMNTNGSERLVINASGLIGIGVTNPTTILDLGLDTSAVGLPVGLTSERPVSAVRGYIRYNTTLENFEGFFASAWTSLGGTISSLDMTNYTIQQANSAIELTLDDTLTDALFTFKSDVNDTDSEVRIVGRREDTDTGAADLSMIGFAFTDQTAEAEIKMGKINVGIGNNVGEYNMSLILNQPDTVESRYVHLEDHQVSIGDDTEFRLGNREGFTKPIKPVMLFGSEQIIVRVESSLVTRSDIAFSMNGGDVDVSAQTDNNGTRLGAININEFHIDTLKLVRLRIGLNGGVRIGDGIGAPASGDITDVFEILPPTDDECFGIVSATTGSTDATSISTNVTVSDVANISDSKSTTVDGGTFTSGSFQTRDLNTSEQSGSFLVSVSANQFTLAAGEYELRCAAPAFGVGAHQARLQNITDATTTAFGTTALSSTSSSSQTNSIINALFTITAQKTFEIQHQATTTNTTNGFGSAHSFGGNEIYTLMSIKSVENSPVEKMRVLINGSIRWIRLVPTNS